MNRPAPPNPEHVVEGLSRAVTAGIVTQWDLFGGQSVDSVRFSVLTADELRHLFNLDEAAAFVAAVFAAERVWPKVSAV